MKMVEASVRELVAQHVKNENLRRHMIVVGAIMGGVAVRLGEDRDLWETVGSVHDVDFEEVDMKEHGAKAAEILRGMLPKEALDAIAAHNHENTGVPPESKMSKGLIASDAVSGLIIAAALVMPDKTLSQVSAKTLMKKFKDKDFARGADRNRIAYCEQVGISMQEFFDIALNSVKAVSKEVGLGGE